MALLLFPTYKWYFVLSTWMVTIITLQVRDSCIHFPFHIELLYNSSHKIKKSMLNLSSKHSNVVYLCQWGVSAPSYLTYLYLVEKHTFFIWGKYIHVLFALLDTIVTSFASNTTLYQHSVPLLYTCHQKQTQLKISEKCAAGALIRTQMWCINSCSWRKSSSGASVWRRSAGGGASWWWNSTSRATLTCTLCRWVWLCVTPGLSEAMILYLI